MVGPAAIAFLRAQDVGVAEPGAELGGLQNSQGFFVTRSIAIAYFIICLRRENGRCTERGA